MIKPVLTLLGKTYQNFIKHDSLSLSAALAFYTALSLAPLLIIIFWISGHIGFESQKEIIEQMGYLIGPGARNAFEFIVKNAENHHITGKISALIAAFFLLFASTRVFVQLHKSMNIIWGIHDEEYKSIVYWLRANFFSLAMLLIFGALLLASIFANTLLAFIFSSVPLLWKWVNLLVTPLIFAVMFALIFKLLPKLKIPWSETLVAAVITSILFTLGNIALGKYIGKSSIGTIYGAAGSLFVFLLWVYYQSLIVFFGAELMQTYSTNYGKRSRLI